jgi:hypothetical protein
MLTGLLHNSRNDDRKVANQTLEDVAEEVLNGMFCHYEPPNPKRNRKKSQKTKSILRRPEGGRAGKLHGKAAKRKGKSSNIGKSVTWSESVEGPEVSPRKMHHPKEFPENEANCSIVEVCMEAGIEAGCLSKNQKANNATRNMVVASKGVEQMRPMEHRSDKNIIMPPPPTPPAPATSSGTQFFPSICGMNCGDDGRQISETKDIAVDEKLMHRSEYESDDEEENSLLQVEDDTGDEDDSDDENESNKENDDVVSPTSSHGLSGLLFKPTFSTNGTTSVTYKHKQPLSMKEYIDNYDKDQDATDFPPNNSLHFLKRIWDRRRPKKSKGENQGATKPSKNAVTKAVSKSPDTNDKKKKDTGSSSKSEIEKTGKKLYAASIPRDPPTPASISPERFSKSPEQKRLSRSKSPKQKRLSRSPVQKRLSRSPTQTRLSRSPMRQPLSSNNDWDTTIPIIPETKQTSLASRGRSPGRASLPITTTRGRSRSEERTSRAKSVSPDGQKLGRSPLAAKSPRSAKKQNPDGEQPRFQKRRSYQDDSYQGPVDVDDMLERQSLITLHRNAFDDEKTDNEKENDRNEDMIERQSFIGAYRESVGEAKLPVDAFELNRASIRNRARSASPVRSKSPGKTRTTDLDKASHTSRSRSKSPGRSSNNSKEARTVRTFNNSPRNKTGAEVRSGQTGALNTLGAVDHPLPAQPIQMYGNMPQIPPSQMSAIEDYYRNNRQHELTSPFLDPTMAHVYPFHNGLYYPDPTSSSVYPHYMGYHPYYSQIQPFMGTPGLNYIVEPTHPSTEIPSQSPNDTPQYAIPHSHMPIGAVGSSAKVDEASVQNPAPYNFQPPGGMATMNSSIPPSNVTSTQPTYPYLNFPTEGVIPVNHLPGPSNPMMTAALNRDVPVDRKSTQHLMTDAAATHDNSMPKEDEGKEDETTWEERTRQAWERLRSGVFSTLVGDASTEIDDVETQEVATAGFKSSQPTKEGKIQQLLLPQLLSPPPSGPPKTDTGPNLHQTSNMPTTPTTTNNASYRPTTPTATSNAMNVSSYAGVSPVSRGMLNGTNQERRVTFGANQQHKIPNGRNRGDLAPKNYKPEQGKKKKVLRGSKYLSGVLGKTKRVSGVAPVQTGTTGTSSARSRSVESDAGIDRAFQNLSVSHSSDGSSQARLSSILHQRNLGAKALTPTNQVIHTAVSHETQGQIQNADFMQYWPQMPRIPHQPHPYAQFMTQGAPQNHQFHFGGPTFTPSYPMPQDMRAYTNTPSTGVNQNEMQNQVMEGPQTSSIYPINSMNSNLYSPEIAYGYFHTNQMVPNQYKQQAPNT